LHVYNPNVLPNTSYLIWYHINHASVTLNIILDQFQSSKCLKRIVTRRIRRSNSSRTRRVRGSRSIRRRRRRIKRRKRAITTASAFFNDKITKKTLVIRKTSSKNKFMLEQMY
jgi:hypothetical protein